MHAVLITAYKDFPTLERMVRRLDPSFFRVFIHIDKRSFVEAAQLQRLVDLGCHCLQKYRIRWGSITHLYAILDLLKRANASQDFDYFHLVTGQDYPVATLDQFKARCDGRIFMNFEPMEDAPPYVVERYTRYNPFFFVQGGPPLSGTVYKYLDRISAWFQSTLGIQRKLVAPYRRLFKGIVWMSFPRIAATKLLEDPAALKFLRSVKTTYLAEEIYFHSYFLNSDLSDRVVNDDLRYTDWTKRNGSVPAYLDSSDIGAALGSSALFARKVSSDVSVDFMTGVDDALFAPGDRAGS